MMALITYGTGRASSLPGVVYLILLETWIFLVIFPYELRHIDKQGLGATGFASAD
jgi:hypothetical protein